MRLPNAQHAHVARQKITDYLLSLNSPDGRSKAEFFSRFGFRIPQWEDLSDALRSHCLQNEVVEVEEAAYGIKYIIVGALGTPDGRNPLVMSVWQIDRGTDHPRFITGRPAR